MTRKLPRGSERDTPALALAYSQRGQWQPNTQRSQWQRAHGLNLLDPAAPQDGRTVLDFLVDLAAPRSGQTALDLGCGTAELIMELARRVGPRERVWRTDPGAARPHRAKAPLRTASGKHRIVRPRQRNRIPYLPGRWT